MAEHLWWYSTAYLRFGIGWLARIVCFVLQIMGKRRGPSKRQAIRLKVFNLIKLGYNNTDIARMSPMARSKVIKWRKRFEAEKGKTEEEIVLSQPREGRPITVTTSPIRKKIIATHEGKRGHSTRKTAKTLRSEGVQISRSSVQNVLQGSGMYPYRRKTQPFLGKSHMLRRMKFAKKFRDHDWEKTLMTDETDFKLFGTTNPQNDRVWAKSGSQVPPRQVVKHSAALKVWGGTSAVGKTSLYFYEGTMGAKKYLPILKKMLPEAEEMFDDENWTFQHDGASAHKAKMINTWLEENVPNHITSGPTGEWPANSPDLNWQENVWSMMDEEVYKDPPPQTMAALKRRVKKAWRNLDQTTLGKMAKGMKQRLCDVIAKKGACIGK